MQKKLKKPCLWGNLLAEWLLNFLSKKIRKWHWALFQLKAFLLVIIIVSQIILVVSIGVDV